MKSISAISVFCILMASCHTKSLVKTSPTEDSASAMVYDSTLASALGADDYGMKKYILAILRVGPNRKQDSATTAKIQRAHLDNINRLANEGKMAIAGPCLDGGEMRGIFIYNVTSVEEAKALFESDPAVQAGRLVAEYHPWYGSAALMSVNMQHKKIAKKKV